MDRIVSSIDADCFYAQCEELRRPSLKGKPLGVRQKGLVITSNYPARRFGIKKGDSLAVVRAKCPSITICDGEDLAFYTDISRRIFEYVAGWAGQGGAGGNEGGSEGRSEGRSEGGRTGGRTGGGAVGGAVGGGKGRMVGVGGAGKVERLGLDEWFVDMTERVDRECLLRLRGPASPTAATPHSQDSAAATVGYVGYVYPRTEPEPVLADSLSSSFSSSSSAAAFLSSAGPHGNHSGGCGEGTSGEWAVGRRSGDVYRDGGGVGSDGGGSSSLRRSQGGDTNGSASLVGARCDTGWDRSIEWSEAEEEDDEDDDEDEEDGGYGNFDGPYGHDREHTAPAPTAAASLSPDASLSSSVSSSHSSSVSSSVLWDRLSFRLAVASQLTAELRAGLEADLGVTTSAGISTSKLLSKLVASLHKPNKQTVFTPTPDNIHALIPHDLPIQRLPGIGFAATQLWREIGVCTCGELAGFNAALAVQLSGGKLRHGLVRTMQGLCRGEDSASVVPSGAPKSVGVEDSFWQRPLVVTGRSSMGDDGGKGDAREGTREDTRAGIGEDAEDAGEGTRGGVGGGGAEGGDSRVEREVARLCAKLLRKVALDQRYVNVCVCVCVCVCAPRD